MTRRNIAVAAILIVAIAVGAWYYFTQARHTSIEKILSNPTVYQGKEVTVEGEVTDRTAFFGVVKFFKVKDKTGEIIVSTKRSLPDPKSTARVKGRIDETFTVGDQKLLVLEEESIDEKGRSK